MKVKHIALLAILVLVLLTSTACGTPSTSASDASPTPPLNHNFIQAVRSRRADDLVSDMLQGHLSAVLVHLGNISHRVGRSMPDREIGERIEGNKELSAAYQRFRAHLSANGVDLDQTPATLGAMLTFDPDTERFVGEFSEAANRLVSRQYRAPFVVPEEV